MENKKAKLYFVYRDQTLEQIPRVFYVGKGDHCRVSKKDRDNVYWERIVAKYGYKRVVILSTKDEKFAFQMEVEYIYKHKTFEADWPDGSGWGANFTRGGEGLSGFRFSKESVEKIRINSTGENNGMFGRKHSPESKQKMREARLGKKLSPEVAKKGALARTGLKRSEETKKKISISNSGPRNSMFGKTHSSEAKEKMSAERSGELNANAKISASDASIIRQKYATGHISALDLSKDYGITKSGIGGILNNRCWKISKEEFFKLKELRMRNLLGKEILLNTLALSR